MDYKIYNETIRSAARAAIGAGSIEQADASVTVHNPLCGDQVCIQVRVHNGRLIELAHRVRGCVLCEAAASMLGEHAPGRDAEELRGVGEAVKTMLKSSDQAPAGLWSSLLVFSPVAQVESRHRCVLLPFEALMATFDLISEQQV
ncbi:MAG: iron-sulfur cluster assembly scaffold protein [Gammaproteobacteria bacterium]|nr:iron-sulfur cluster assembly scaffold protein [Gammaproteobacteria bacterium]